MQQLPATVCVTGFHRSGPSDLFYPCKCIARLCCIEQIDPQISILHCRKVTVRNSHHQMPFLCDKIIFISFLIASLHLNASTIFKSMILFLVWFLSLNASTSSVSRTIRPHQSSSWCHSIVQTYIYTVYVTNPNLLSAAWNHVCPSKSSVCHRVSTSGDPDRNNSVSFLILMVLQNADIHFWWIKAIVFLKANQRTFFPLLVIFCAFTTISLSFILVN